MGTELQGNRTNAFEGRVFTMLVNGEASHGSDAFDVIDPALGEPFAKCPRADEALLDEAVEAAAAAFPAWSATPADERAALLVLLAERLDAASEEFATLLTREQGKPLADARGEVAYGGVMLRTVAAMRPKDKVLVDDENGKVVEYRRPLGVVAAITPWNVPLLLMLGKIAPALVTGNTVVVKPAPTTPLTTLLFGELCHDILPPGVLNIICDENDLGGRLTSHPLVRKVAFTGSTATGKKVMASAAASVKRVTLELGGNDAAIVLDDLDPVEAARKIYPLAMVNSGQICMAVKRVFVPDDLYDPFVAEMARLADATVVGDGLAEGVQLGPVQNKVQYEKLKGILETAHRDGLVVAGGKPLDRPGYFIQPTIVRDIPDDAPLVAEEQFGPVVPVLRYSEIDDAVARANSTVYGLGASVWSNQPERARDVAMQLEAGTVWINRHLAARLDVPFRGAKQSGLGSEMGQEGIEEYTQGHVVMSYPA